MMSIDLGRQAGKHPQLVKMLNALPTWEEKEWKLRQIGLCLLAQYYDEKEEEEDRIDIVEELLDFYVIASEIVAAKPSRLQ